MATDPPLVEPIDVLLSQLAIVSQALSSHSSQPWSKHHERTENSYDEERDKAADLQFESRQAFAPIEDSTRHEAREHGSLSEQDWAEGINTLAEERQTGGAIWMSRNEV